MCRIAGRAVCVKRKGFHQQKQRPERVGLGGDWKLLPSCPETIVPSTTLARLIFSDGWMPRTCFNRSAWLMVRAVAPYEASRYLVLAFCVTKKAVQQEETISASGKATRIDHYGVWCSTQLAQKHELLALIQRS